jgi:hypothetical protein
MASLHRKHIRLVLQLGCGGGTHLVDGRNDAFVPVQRCLTKVSEPVLSNANRGCSPFWIAWGVAFPSLAGAGDVVFVS